MVENMEKYIFFKNDNLDMLKHLRKWGKSASTNFSGNKEDLEEYVNEYVTNIEL